jgi:hypothetical protein
MALAEAPHHTNPADAIDGAYVRPSTKQAIVGLLWTLFDLGGEIRCKQGKAGRALVNEAVAIGYRMPTQVTSPISAGSLSQLLQEMDHGRFAGLISREVGPKRTYAIKLLLTEDQLPPRPPLLTLKAIEPKANGGPTDPRTTQEPKPPATEPEQAPVTTPSVPPDVEPEPEPEVNDPQPEPTEDEQLADEATLPSVPTYAVEATEPIDALLMIQHLAMQAAIGIAGQLGQPPAPENDRAELHAVQERLADTLDENQRLRRKLADVCETTNAKAKECEALRKALMVSSSNLKALQAASNQGPSLERKLANLKNVQSFIASPPKAKALR